MASYSISKVTTAQDLADTITLFEAYARSLGIDLAFQDFAAEMAQMPGKYSPPSGALLLARNTDATAVGCVGLRRLDSETCEMKRLYVDPAGRGSGVGRELASAVVDEARSLKYKAMRLDTLPTMGSARALYRSLGFERTRPYYSTPIEGTLFLELQLQP